MTCEDKVGALSTSVAVLQNDMEHTKTKVDSISATVDKIWDKLDQHTVDITKTSTTQKIQSGGFGAAGGGIVIVATELIKSLFK